MYNECFAGALPIHGRISTTPDRGAGHRPVSLSRVASASSQLGRALRKLRATLRHRLGQAAARLIGPRSYGETLRPEEISSVLICRVNARMGNAVFLTPLIRRIHELLPRASIDLATAYPKAEDLLGSLPGMRRVIRFPYKGVHLLWRYCAAVRRLRRERFDLVIDPTPNSTSGRLILMLARARYRLGYATDNQWAPLTHAVPQPAAIMHQAAWPIFLVSRALGAQCDPSELRLWLPLSAQEIEAGRAAIERAVAKQGVPGLPQLASSAEGPEPMWIATRACGFFAHATGLKTVAPDYWRAFWDAFLQLEPAAVPIEILPSPSSPPTDPRSVSLHFPSPRALTAAMSTMRLFVCADTGPMHLASSTRVPTVGLFRASNPALYAPLKPCDLALDVTQHSPRAVAEYCQRVWRASAAHAGGAFASSPT